MANTDADAIILRAITELEEQKDQIEARINKLREALEGATPEPAIKGRVSPTTRRKISDSQKKRWADLRERKQSLGELETSVAEARTKTPEDPLEDLARKADNAGGEQ